MKTKFAMPRQREVPFIPTKTIEEEAALLLAEYAVKHGEIVAPPVPIDRLVEFHLGLEFGFMDLREELGVADVHGALWVKAKRIGVDESLDPAVFPNMEGRYHFTLAHEVGHWRLHRKQFLDDPDQSKLFTGGAEKPDVVCRSGDKHPLERQADYFASFLLIPRHMVLPAWAQHRGSMDPMTLDRLNIHRSEIVAAEIVRRGGVVMMDEAGSDAVFEWFCRPLADAFKVSPTAMRIRLEGMGLLLRKKQESLF